MPDLKFNLELVAKFIFLFSLIGMGLIIYRKIPLLVTLPEAIQKGEGSLEIIRKKIGKISPFKNFSYELFLGKILTKIRIFILKIENFLFQKSQQLRENQKKKIKDNYWEEIKKEMKK